MELPWPARLLSGRQPEVVNSCEAFAQSLASSHLQKAVLFPQGLRKLGLEARWPAELQGALSTSQSVLGVLASLNLDDYQGNLECVDGRWMAVDVLELAEKRQVLPCDEATELAQSWFTEVTDDSQELPAALPDAVVQRAVLRRKAMAATALGELHGLYLCEMRPLAERTSVYEEDGLFIGGPGSGKGLHVDQRPESNVGKQWQGRKLFAAWPVECEKVMEECYGEVFSSPTAKQMKALEQATQLFILEAGDLFLFNGQMPHTALCLPGELNVTSYEGFQSLHPDHIAQFLSVAHHFRGPWQRVGQEWKDELQQQLRSLQEARGAPKSGRRCGRCQ